MVRIKSSSKNKRSKNNLISNSRKGSNSHYRKLLEQFKQNLSRRYKDKRVKLRKNKIKNIKDLKNVNFFKIFKYSELINQFLKKNILLNRYSINFILGN